MSHGFALPEIFDDSVGNDKLRNSAALSVIGRSANSTGDPADIAGSAAGDALMLISGPTIGFGVASSWCGPEINRYHPDREPLVGLDTACSDNFIGGEQLTWRWGNQGTSTLTSEMDTSVLVPQAVANNSFRCRWITAPNAVDFTFTAKMTVMLRNNLQAGGIQVLSTGNETTPTTIDRLVIRARSLALNIVHRCTNASYTAADANDVQENMTAGSNFAPVHTGYLQFRYVASSKVLTAYHCSDGMTWKLHNARTLAAHPISIGWHATSGSTNTPTVQARIHWFRTFTSGVNSATAAQYTDGQVGS